MSKVAIAVEPNPASEKACAGAVVTLTSGALPALSETTSDNGIAEFLDVDPGEYTACVTVAPSFFVPKSTKTLTVAQNDLTDTLQIVPLVLTLKSTEPESGSIPQQVEVWAVDGVRVADVALDDTSTEVPIPKVGKYRIQVTGTLLGGLQPPSDIGPTVEFSKAKPAKEVQIPERTAKLLLKIKDGTSNANDILVKGIGIQVRDAAGLLPTTSGAGPTNLRNTGEHTLTVIRLPADYELACGSPISFDVIWNRAPNPSPEHLNQQIEKTIVLRAIPTPVPGLAYNVSQVVVWLLGISAVISFGLSRFKGNATAVKLGSLAPALLVLSIGLILLHLAGRSRRGIFEPLIGLDGRTSVSRIAPALWTLALVVVMCRNANLVSWKGDELTNTLDDNWEAYLILLGGPWATAVLAKATVNYKVTNGILQKSSSDQAEVLDALRDDDGQTSLIDAQYLLFNIVALTFFLIAYISQGPNLPEIPALLLALTSGAAAVYVGNKAADQNRPTLSGLVPASVRPGDELTISGQNFIPPGTTAADGVTVTLSGYGLLPPVNGKTPTDTDVVVQVPANVPSGYPTVTVASAARVSTEPRTLEVVSADLLVVGLVEPSIVPGETVHLLVDNHRARPDGEPMAYFVGFDGQWVQARLTAEVQPRLEVTSPRSLKGSTIAVAVRDGTGRTSVTTSVAVDSGPKIVGATATRITGKDKNKDKVQVIVDAVGVLPPTPTEDDVSGIRVGDSVVTVSERRTVGGSRDHLVVTAPLAATARSISIIAVDWTGQTTTPRPVKVA